LKRKTHFSEVKHLPVLYDSSIANERSSVNTAQLFCSPAGLGTHLTRNVG